MIETSAMGKAIAVIFGFDPVSLRIEEQIRFDVKRAERRLQNERSLAVMEEQGKKLKRQITTAESTYMQALRHIPSVQNPIDAVHIVQTPDNQTSFISWHDRIASYQRWQKNYEDEKLRVTHDRGEQELEPESNEPEQEHIETKESTDNQLLPHSLPIEGFRGYVPEKEKSNVIEKRLGTKNITPRTTMPILRSQGFALAA